MATNMRRHYGSQARSIAKREENIKRRIENAKYFESISKLSKETQEKRKQEKLEAEIKGKEPDINQEQ